MRTTTIDPLAEKYYSISPYAWCGNNPVSRIDPDGMADYFGIDGKWYGNDGADNDLVRVIAEENWKNMQSKDDNGNVTYDIELGMISSIAFSKATNLTDDATLAIYNHFNPTDLKLSVRKEENGVGGMTFNVDKKGEKLEKTIEINVQNNRNQGIANHSNEIISCFSHEKKHKDDFDNWGLDVYINTPLEDRETRAVYTQIKHESFLKTRDPFQKTIILYGKKNKMLFLLRTPSTKL